MANDTLNDYEAQRQAKIKHNQALLKQLNIQRLEPTKSEPEDRPIKRQKLAVADARPSRSSARVASAPKPIYDERTLTKTTIAKPVIKRKAARTGKRRSSRNATDELGDDEADAVKREPPANIEDLQASWTDWTPLAPEPTREDITGVFHFKDQPTFRPNKSPEEMLKEGCFGGSYFRPLYSRVLATTISDDWKELPSEWTEDLNVQKYLISPSYDPDINKYKVQAGLPIEEWEASGWVNHRYDVRGWFQWYCRFYMGRRCDDDERQIRRWRNCVGETGRWRLSLLRKYVKEGVKSVFDDGEDGEDAAEVSPVQHQTCHHWGFEIRQGVLDEFWARQR